MPDDIKAPSEPNAPPLTVTVADHHHAVVRARRWRVAIVLAAMLVIFAIWEILPGFVAYTGDAYVRSDFVTVSAEVSGHIASIAVRDDQAVKRGDLMVTIDKTPFQLAVDQCQAQLRQANAQADVAQANIAVAQDRLNAAKATLAYAQVTEQRAAALSNEQFASRQDFDQTQERLRNAQADTDSATAAVAGARQGLAAAQAAIAAAEAALATAEWNLDRTNVRAPVDGTVNNFHIRVGDTAKTDDPLIGIIDADQWRVVADYKQNTLQFLPIGTAGWVWLDSHPWHLYRAHVTAVARGISRDKSPPMLLPYIAPTTDWIRLQRRFPVLLTIDKLPPDVTLYMGSDARVLIFP